MVRNISIGGSARIGRRIAVGGDISAGGSIHIKHDLRVDGWLDAPNLRNPAKGLYATLEELEEAHRFPRPGSWALVGKSLPATLYVASGRKWVSTGTLTGTPVVAPVASEPGDIASELCSCRGALDALDLRLDEAEKTADEAFDRASANGILPFDGFNPLRPGARPTSGVWFVPPTAGSPGNFWVISSPFGLTADDYNDVDASTSGNPELSPARTDCLYRCGASIYAFDGERLLTVASAPVELGSAAEAQAMAEAGLMQPGQLYCVVDSETRMVNSFYLG